MEQGATLNTGPSTGCRIRLRPELLALSGHIHVGVQMQFLD